VQILDNRNPSAERGVRAYYLRRPLGTLYEACSDEPIRVSRLMEKLNLDIPEEDIREALDKFCERGLMIKEGDRYLSLALPA
jgi:hypothetical protein